MSEGDAASWTPLDARHFELFDYFAYAWDTRGDGFGVFGVLQVGDAAAQVCYALAHGDQNGQISGRGVFAQLAPDGIGDRLVAGQAVHRGALDGDLLVFAEAAQDLGGAASVGGNHRVVRRRVDLIAALHEVLGV